jgi:CRP-like cAMP-binding protein
MSVIVQELSKIKIFAGFSEIALEDLAKITVLASYGDGESILFEADEKTPVIFIAHGTVRIFRTNPEGREQTLITLHAGDGFNLPTAFIKNSRSPASASAIGNVTALRIHSEDFRKIVVTNPEIALAVLEDLSGKLEYLTDLLHDVSLRTVRGRLAKFLLDPIHKEPNAIRWTHEQMAARLGTTREVVSRMIGVFIQEGLIKTERHRIVIMNAAKLRSLVE